MRFLLVADTNDVIVLKINLNDYNDKLTANILKCLVKNYIEMEEYIQTNYEEYNKNNKKLNGYKTLFDKEQDKQIKNELCYINGLKFNKKFFDVDKAGFIYQNKKNLKVLSDYYKIKNLEYLNQDNFTVNRQNFLIKESVDSVSKGTVNDKQTKKFIYKFNDEKNFNESFKKFVKILFNKKGIIHDKTIKNSRSTNLILKNNKKIPLSSLKTSNKNNMVFKNLKRSTQKKEESDSSEKFSKTSIFNLKSKEKLTSIGNDQKLKKYFPFPLNKIKHIKINIENISPINSNEYNLSSSSSFRQIFSNGLLNKKNFNGFNSTKNIYSNKNELENSPENIYNLKKNQDKLSRNNNNYYKVKKSEEINNDNKIINELINDFPYATFSLYPLSIVNNNTTKSACAYFSKVNEDYTSNKLTLRKKFSKYFS